MSLKFLSKKSWHTTNLDNVEKVWIAEQNAEKEKKKLSELQKQINEERQIQELRQLQVASGQVVKTVDTSLDWMYEGPAAQSEQTTEEYLLGKIFKPKDNSTNELKEIGQQPGSLWVNNISQRNDTFTRLHEDPMLLIKKNEKEAREKVVNNPVKMARIRHQLASEIESKKQKKEQKREKKREEKEKVKEKKSKERRVSRSRSHDQNRGRDGDGYRGSERSQRSLSHDRKRRRSRSRSRSRNGDRDRHHDRRESGRARYDDRRDRSRSPDGIRKPSDRRSRSPENRRSEVGVEAKATRAEERSTKPESRADERENQSLKGRYGLILTGNTDRAVDESNEQRRKTGDYGPKQELLAKKREEEAKQENERKKKLQQSRTSGFSNQLSAEEKEKRLKAMMTDAVVNDEMRLHRHRPGSKATTATSSADAPTTSAAGGADGDNDDGHEPTAKGIAKGTFLQSLRSEVYTSETTAGNGMEDRMRRNRHYYQKGLDLESEGFMKKE